MDDVDNWNAESKSKLTFLDFFEQEMYKKPIKAGTLKTHKTLLLGLVRFGKIVQFKDITYPNIADFDVFLRKTLKSQPILYKRHNTLNSYIKEAKRRKLITDNPYDEFKIKKGKSKEPIVLDETELKKLIDYKPTNSKIERVRDMYLFQCMTGLAFVDMQNFSKDKISYVDNEPIINCKSYQNR